MSKLSNEEIAKRFGKMVENMIYLKHPYCVVDVETKPNWLFEYSHATDNVMVEMYLTVKVPMFGRMFWIQKSERRMITYFFQDESMVKLAKEVADSILEEMIIKAENLSADYVSLEWVSGVVDSESRGEGCFQRK